MLIALSRARLNGLNGITATWTKFCGGCWTVALALPSDQGQARRRGHGEFCRGGSCPVLADR